MADELLRPSVAGTATPTYDAGLRAHMQRVFNYMAGGLALTGVLAFVVANTALAGIIFGTPLKWVAIFSPFVFVMWLQVRIQHMSAAKARTLFWLFCGTMGLSMASIFLVFTGASVARAFFITSATFAAMSLYGYTTKRNLIGLGAFFMMGMIGLMIAIVVNLFLMSSMLQWLVSVAGVAIFTGLTAFSVQQIKRTYDAAWGSEANDKLAVFGALQLYLNFINAFQFLLMLTGNRR